MAKKKEEKQKEVKVEEVQYTEEQVKEQLEKYDFDVAHINFTFPMTRDEAREVLDKPKGKTSKEFAKYFRALVESAAKKFIEVPKGEEVQCKVPIEGNVTKS